MEHCLLQSRKALDRAYARERLFGLQKLVI